jgi:hypothetical protein
VVHEEVEKGNLLAGALVVIYVFDYQWQDPKITPKYLSQVLKLSFWKSTVEVIGGKVQSSREMSCELSLQWKLILSVSFGPYSERNGAEQQRSQDCWLNRILKCWRLALGLLVPQVRTAAVTLLCCKPGSNWQKENKMKNATELSKTPMPLPLAP